MQPLPEMITGIKALSRFEQCLSSLGVVPTCDQFLNLTSMENTLRVVPLRQDLDDSGATRFVDFTILQLNDVYDAMPVEGGRRGGLARVTTLYQQLREENPNIFSVMVGDFLAPSAIGATLCWFGGLIRILTSALIASL